VTSRALARAGLVVFIAFLGSRILGWVRMAVIANQFGSPNPELDAYLAAFRIPDLIYQLVAAGAVGTALVPVLSGLVVHGEPGRAWRVASSVANLMLVALLVASIAFAVLAPWIVPLMVPRFTPENIELTIHLTRIMLLSPILLGLGAVVSAVLNTQGRFAAAALAPVSYNLCIIAAAVLLAPSMGIDALAIGVVVGALAHVLVQVPALRGWFRYLPGVDLRDPAARQSMVLMLPRAIGLGASQITFVVNVALATFVGVGAVTAYTYAFTTLQIPLGVVGFPLGIVLLPPMSRALATGDAADFGRMVTAALRLVLWTTIFFALVGIVVRNQTVETLYGGGFSPAAITLTADTLLVFLIGLPAHTLNVILARGFYSAKDTSTPVLVALLSVAVNVTVSILAIGPLGVPGLALGIALGGWVEAAILTAILWRRTHAFAVRLIGEAAALSLGGGLIAAGLAFVTLVAVEPVRLADTPRISALAELVLASLTAGAGYLLYSRLVRLPELPRALGLLRSALHRG
jgi:putative peptidoglycan lipid II flippase